jgi:hypothetical protein
LIDASTAPYALLAYKYLVPLISLSNQGRVISSFLEQFTLDNATRSTAIECLERIFLSHRDAESMVKRHFDELLDVLTCPEVSSFMIKFLRRFATVFVKCTSSEAPLVRLLQVALSVSLDDVCPDFWDIGASLLRPE